MIQNLDDINARGESLENLEQKADSLRLNSSLMAKKVNSWIS